MISLQHPVMATLLGHTSAVHAGAYPGVDYVAQAYPFIKSVQVFLIKQEKVGCLVDNEATLALDPNNPYAVQVSGA